MNTRQDRRRGTPVRTSDDIYVFRRAARHFPGMRVGDLRTPATGDRHGDRLTNSDLDVLSVGFEGGYGHAGD